MEKNREEQLMKKIKRLERKISDLYEKCNELSYALERERNSKKSK